jgi:hypothetical protein
VPEDFLVARNPDGDSRLPYLLRIPLADRPIILKARDTWPRTSKVYCHRVEAWPDEPEIVERVTTRSCVRRGAAIDLVLDRSRQNRSQLVITRLRDGRQVIFWQSPRTTRQARPAVAVPTARASGVATLEIVVDSRERYPYRFAGNPVTVVREALPAGDYGLVCDGVLMAAVERKSLADLVSSLTTGRLKYQLADLAAVPHAALIVEDRYSSVFKLDRVRPAVVADGLAECQVRWPSVPIVFAETRKLAEQWAYRFLAAAATGGAEDAQGAETLLALVEAESVPARSPTPATVRAWARSHGHTVSDRGRVPRALIEAYLTEAR